MDSRKRNVSAYLYLLPGIIVVLIFIYLPVVLNVVYSLHSFNSFSKDMTYVGLRNYTRLIADSLVWSSLWHNTWYAIVSVVFQIGLSLVIAAVLEERVFRRFQPVFRSIYFLPSIMSLTVIGLLWQMLYSDQVGLINAFLRTVGLGEWARDWLGNSQYAMNAVIAVSQWQYTGYTLMLFIVAIQKIPEEINESARLDGANAFQRFRYITIPQVRSMTLVNVITTVVGAYKVYDEVFVMTGGGPGRSTEVLATYIYRSAFRTNEMGYASTIAVLVFLITFGFSLIQMKMNGFGTKE